ncbi:hypothetical protein D3C84_1085670 [compost metagenome]
MPAVAGNRLLYRDGVPVATLVAGKVALLQEVDAVTANEWRAALIRQPAATPLGQQSRRARMPL